MTKTSEFRTKPSEPPSSAAARAAFLPVSHTQVPLDRGGLPGYRPRTGPEACLGRSLPVVSPIFQAAFHRWIDPEVLLLGHRQQFWIAARRRTMRAVDAGLLSVDCLKACHTTKRIR